MRFYFDDLMELTGIILALYGLFCLLKKGYQKIMSIDIEKRKNVFGATKIFLIGIIAGLILYVTPLVNETMKILLSLIMTLGAFVATFILKEKKGYNFDSRIVLFIGQIFFGITMLLLMINTNLGYSILSVFAIWTIFNVYIYKQFKNPENAFMLTLTSIICVISILDTYSNTLDTSLWIAIMCVILLSCEVFNVREKLIGCGIQNLLFTVLLIMIGSINNTDDSLVIFLITFVFLVATAVLTLLKNKKVDLKSFLIYIPFIVMVLLAGIKDDFGIIISLFNLLVAIWLVSEKSIYKKLLTSIFMILGVYALLERTYLNDIYQLIVIGSTLLTFVYLFEPKKVAELAKGDGSDEE